LDNPAGLELPRNVLIQDHRWRAERIYSACICKSRRVYAAGDRFAGDLESISDAAETDVVRAAIEDRAITLWTGLRQ
jgi:hypothetical protein